VLSLAASIIAAVACPPTAVHYTPNGVPGIQQIPWIQAAPASAGIRGLLWYYDSAGAWGKTHVPFAHVYAGGEDPSGRVSMKILWVARRSGGGPAIAITGRRLDGDGLFRQRFQRVSGAGSGQYASIVEVPAPGCWQLTLTTGRLRAKAVFVAV